MRMPEVEKLATQSKVNETRLKTTVLEELTCCICLELLSSPVIFECGHSVCTHCARHLLRNAGRDQIVKCPLCSHVTVLKNGTPLKQNITLNYLIVTLMYSNDKQPHHHHQKHHKKNKTKQYEAVITNLRFIADEAIRRWELEFKTKVFFLYIDAATYFSFPP